MFFTYFNFVSVFAQTLVFFGIFLSLYRCERKVTTVSSWSILTEKVFQPDVFFGQQVEPPKISSPLLLEKNNFEGFAIHFKGS